MLVPSSDASPLARDERFMREALAEALRGLEAGEVPVGAVVVVGETIVARSHNAPIGLADPTAHAEILALREAARKTRNYRLTGAWLYATVEPCLMCCGAVIHARLDRLVYGARDPKGGAVESLYRVLEDRRLNHRVRWAGGVLEGEASAVLARFFDSKRR